MSLKHLEKRIERLEKQNRRWKLCFALLAIVTACVFSLGAVGKKTAEFDELKVDHLTARYVQLKDADGKMTHAMGSRKSKSELKFKNGSSVDLVELYPGPYFYMFDTTGKNRTFRVSQGYDNAVQLQMSSSEQPYRYNVELKSADGLGSVDVYSDPWSRSGAPCASINAVGGDGRGAANVMVSRGKRTIRMNASYHRHEGDNVCYSDTSSQKVFYWPFAPQ